MPAYSPAEASPLTAPPDGYNRGFLAGDPSVLIDGGNDDAGDDGGAGDRGDQGDQGDKIDAVASFRALS